MNRARCKCGRRVPYLSDDDLCQKCSDMDKKAKKAVDAIRVKKVIHPYHRGLGK